ncbi:MAG: hypothetical protein QOI10_3396 [Solirubrobacterales bacterium]|jgi:hypothetical protein|nr:hypothetical protein [Solirubrobacterales bacterium]
MTTTKALAGAFSMTVIALGLAACGGDSTTTVTETSASAAGATTTATTGGGEAASEEIAPPDAKAQKQIDQIQQGVDQVQQQTDSSSSDTIVGGSGGAPALSFSSAKGNLNRGRYCGSYVVAGPNTSCAFAINVAYDYYNSGRASHFVSYSPITGQAYQVYCKYRHPTICVAGNNATIYIGP